MHTNGGRIEPAYLISKCCKASNQRFIVVIPRIAKSAGTLIALGADEIHMGMMSELGPIDPQIGEYPALGLGSAVSHIVSLCEKYPASSQMLASYLSTRLNLHDLGYYERVSESAVQYAEILLRGKKLPGDNTEGTVAQRFVYGYKDHGFVIDRDEALKYLGDSMVRSDSKEYKLANEIHEFLEDANLAYRIFHRHYCSILGNIRDGMFVNDLQRVT